MVGTQLDRGEVKNSIGNGEAKELICTTLGHDLRRGMLEGREYRVEGARGEKSGQLWQHSQ